MGYTKQVLKGFSWAAALNATSLAVSFLKIVLLSHFVFGPKEFGIFGVGVLVLGILELITETGINVFLVQEKDPLTVYLDTAWVTSILRGIVISALVALLSYPVAIFFQIQADWTFILAFALIPLLRGFINPAITNLQKKLRFKEDAFFRFSVSAVEDLSIIAFAFLTRNIFSFVIGILIGVIFEVTITFIFVKERPQLKFNKIHFQKIVDRGKWVTLALIFDYLFEHTDDIVVGKLLNVASLGIYQNSYTLARLPENIVGGQLGKVTFPVYVQFLDDKKRLKRAFFRSFWFTLGLVAPFSLALFFLSDPIIRLVLGTKWLAAIPVLRVLSLFALVRSLSSLFSPLFLAFKKQNYISMTTLASILVLGVIIFPLTFNYGITGAAFAALVGSIASLPICFYYFYKLVK